MDQVLKFKSKYVKNKFFNKILPNLKNIDCMKEIIKDINDFDFAFRMGIGTLKYE